MQYKYHSCRNRHCPSCQGKKVDKWISKQQESLLDVPYFHVVFTLPKELRTLCLHKPRIMYSLLFRASWETINTLAGDSKYLGAKTGMTAVLHTWSQNLSLHPHLHCIVPGGGVTNNGAWKTTRSKGKYLFPKQVLSTIYRAIFMRELLLLHKSGQISLDRSTREKLYTKRWVVYAKRPFAKPQNVIEYLGRYTHKVAISNYRIIDVSETHVTFKWKDYRHASTVKEMTLNIREFIRRFAMHILPHRFVRIRHYGILSNHGRKAIIPKIQDDQNFKPEVEQFTPRSEPKPESCPKVNSQRLICTILAKNKNRAP